MGYCFISIVLAVMGFYLLVSHPSFEEAFDDHAYFAIEIILTVFIVVELTIGVNLCGKNLWNVNTYYIDFFIAVVSVVSLLIDEFIGDFLPYHEEDFIRFLNFFFN